LSKATISPNINIKPFKTPAGNLKGADFFASKLLERRSFRINSLNPDTINDLAGKILQETISLEKTSSVGPVPSDEKPYKKRMKLVSKGRRITK